MKTRNKLFKLATLAGCIAAAMGSANVNATHFRGATIVPSIDANGVLTVQSKSFWRKNSGTGTQSLSVSGGIGSLATSPLVLDNTDIRRTEVNQTYTTQLTTAGTYTMTWGSGSWVHNVPNASGNYGTTSSIFWDGTNANTPISFDLENIQQQVVRGVAYSDNLDAVGTGLTYDTTGPFATGVTAQAPGYSVSATGQINMSAATTAAILDNPNAASVGADVAHTGKITAADGSVVQYVWVFDAVATGSNLAPAITDIIVNALVGATIDETLVVVDPNVGDIVTTSFISLVGPGGVMPGNATFDPNTLEFDWDSTGFGVGTYIATFGASDGALTDQGTITINLTNIPGGNVPEPGTLLLFGAGAMLLAGRRRKRKA